MAKSPQSEAVEVVQKKDNGTMPPNKAGHINCFHCGSNHHWACDCDQLIKTQLQTLYAAKPRGGGEAWAKVKAEVESTK